MDIIFIEHAKEMLKKRKITKEEVELGIKYLDNLKKEGGKYITEKDIERARIEIVYEKDKYIKIITTYYIWEKKNENNF